MRTLSVCVLFLVVLLTSGLCDIAGATNMTPSKTQGDKTGKETLSVYPVTLGNQKLFFFNDIKGLPAERRAKALSEKLKGIAEDPSIRTDTISLSDYNQPMTLAQAEDQMLFVVLDEDARFEGKNRHELARERSEIVRTAIEKYRHDYGRKQIILGIVYSVLATAVLLAVLYLVVRVHRTIAARVNNWAATKMKKLHMESLALGRTETVNTFLVASVKIVRFAIFAVILYSYVHLLLSFFPWTRSFSGKLLDFIMAPLRVMGETVLREFPNVIFVAIIAFFTFLALKMMRAIFKGLESGTITIQGFYPEWSQPTYNIFRILIIAFAGVVAFPYIPGSSSAAFKGISLFLGVLFSLGSTSAIANILAGYSLTYRRVFKIGDRVKIGDFVGDVVETRLQVVSLKTIKNEVIVVPSSTIVNTNVMNYSTLAKEQGLILHTKVTIGYDAPWRQVEALLLKAARATEGALGQPEPFVLQTSLDDYYVTYELNVYTEQPEAMAEVYANLHRNIQDAFNEYGVQIMSPAYRADPSQPKVVPRDQWYAPPARKSDDQSEG